MIHHRGLQYPRRRAGATFYDHEPEPFKVCARLFALHSPSSCVPSESANIFFDKHFCGHHSRNA